jgi:hypothetical protein
MNILHVMRPCLNDELGSFAFRPLSTLLLLLNQEQKPNLGIVIFTS